MGRDTIVKKKEKCSHKKVALKWIVWKKSSRKGIALVGGERMLAQIIPLNVSCVEANKNALSATSVRRNKRPREVNIVKRKFALNVNSDF